MNQMLVQQVMIPLAEYPCISDTHTLRQAVEAMGKVQIHRNGQASLPRVVLVFDESMTKLRGLLGRRDIMRGLEPRFLVRGSLDYRRKLFDVDVDTNLSELSYDKIISNIRKRADEPVSKCVVPIKGTVDYDDHIMKAMYELVNHNVSLLPVLRDGDIVGVVRSVDVMNEIAKVLNV